MMMMMMKLTDACCVLPKGILIFIGGYLLCTCSMIKSSPVKKQKSLPSAKFICKAVK